jgi:50S ribosomal protein L16 3-hydroxylase
MKAAAPESVPFAAARHCIAAHRPIIPAMPDARTLLGGITVAAFLREHWQKAARLVRSAVPGFAGLADRPTLERLAMRDDVESRLVIREGRRWSLAHGPFRRADFRDLPARNWTLLVQGLNLHLDAADALLRRFAFLPYARLDDLMVSYAVPGGGVGPHFDSYDVFLLQGFGRRRWRYGRQDDLALAPGLPLRILRRFAPEHDHVLAPGDMLYLPPQYAHDGVAVDECTTYSIGFRAASSQEFAVAFLDFLRDDIALDGRYADPDLAPVREPARIPAAMRRRVAGMLEGVKWDASTVARFLGTFLSEPKPAVCFDPPHPPLGRAAFARRVAARGLALDRRTQLLYDDDALYVNGERCAWPADGRNALARLANARALPASDCAALPAPALAQVYAWYCDGYLSPAG